MSYKEEQAKIFNAILKMAIDKNAMVENTNNTSITLTQIANSIKELDTDKVDFNTLGSSIFSEDFITGMLVKIDNEDTDKKNRIQAKLNSVVIKICTLNKELDDLTISKNLNTIQQELNELLDELDIKASERDDFYNLLKSK